MEDGLNEKTTLRIARHDCGSVVATRQQSLALIDTQPVTNFLTSVTFQAMLDQDRADFGFKERLRVAGQRLSGGRRWNQQKEEGASPSHQFDPR